MSCKIFREIYVFPHCCRISKNINLHFNLNFDLNFYRRTTLEAVVCNYAVEVVFITAASCCLRPCCCLHSFCCCSACSFFLASTLFPPTFLPLLPFLLMLASLFLPESLSLLLPLLLLSSRSCWRPSCCRHCCYCWHSLCCSHSCFCWRSCCYWLLYLCMRFQARTMTQGLQHETYWYRLNKENYWTNEYLFRI